MRTPIATLAAIAAIAAFSGLAAPAAAAVLPAYNPDCNIPGVKAPLPCPTQSSHDFPEARICFYIRTDFTDRHFCEAGARTVNVIRDSWKHAVKSIEIGANSSVRVCSKPDMKGICTLLDDSTRTLVPQLFGHLYSYRIEKVRY